MMNEALAYFVYGRTTPYASAGLVILLQPELYWGTGLDKMNPQLAHPSRRLTSPPHTGPRNQHVARRAAKQHMHEWSYCGETTTRGRLRDDHEPRHAWTEYGVGTVRLPHGRNGWMSTGMQALQQE